MTMSDTTRTFNFFLAILFKKQNKIVKLSFDLNKFPKKDIS